MLSVTVQYALRAMVALASLPDGVLGCAACIAQRAAVPQNYLSKLLKQLARAGLLVSQKGLGGGFKLARPAAQISLFDIVAPLDNAQRLCGCLLGPGGCNPDQPCAAHERWRGPREAVEGYLHGTTLAQLAAPRPRPRPRRAARAARS
jgi:Rrf2 family protein